MELLFERVAGLDVGKASVTVCVRTPGPNGRRVSEVRTFSTMTRSLQVMRDWLLASGVTMAAIESTSTYGLVAVDLEAGRVYMRSPSQGIALGSST